MTKKKVAKKVAKKKAVVKNKNIKRPTLKKNKVSAKQTAIKDPIKLFDEWYSKFASKKVEKIEKEWVKGNEPNDPNEDGGGDHWCVNEMMHNGDAHEMTAEIAEEVFLKGYNNEPWTMAQENSLYCDLDEIIEMAYPAGKEAKERN